MKNADISVHVTKSYLCHAWCRTNREQPLYPAALLLGQEKKIIVSQARPHRFLAEASFSLNGRSKQK